MDDPTLDPIPDATLVARAARWLQPTPAELTGLVILVLGAVAATGVLWFQATQRPSDLASPAASAGVAALADAGTDLADAEVTAGGPDTGPLGSAHGSDPEDRRGDGHDAGHDAVHDAGSDAEVTVHATGAVANPGVVVLPEGDRVSDVVVAAGGLTADAAEESINLARAVSDGERVHIPREGEEPPPPGWTNPGADGTGALAPGITPDGKVDINRAGPAALDTLPGIGPARAERIVAHREEHGPFTVPGDLRAVAGIGEVIFQQMADRVTVR